MHRLIPLLFIFLTTTAYAETLKVAIIDTGIDMTDSRFSAHICPNGHKNFVQEQTSNDTNGHGTFVAGLIQEYAGKGNYCFLFYKFYTDFGPGSVNLKHEVEAIREAIVNGAKIVNISGSGPQFNEEESLLIKYNPQITFVVAAGNNGKNLDIPGNEVYPASYFYGNEKVVGAIDKFNKIIPSSNYGKKVESNELGENVRSTMPDGRYGYMSGTSMACAIHTGKLVKEMLNATH